MSWTTLAHVSTGELATAALHNALLDNLSFLLGLFNVTMPREWPGSEAASLMGTTYGTGSTRALRAPGTSLLVVSANIDVVFEAVLWAESGATATVALFRTSAPNTVVTGSALTSTDTDGERKYTGTLTLTAGTYFIKGHSNSSTLQAWGESYVIRPA